MQYIKVLFFVFGLILFNSKYSFSQDDALKNYHLKHEMSYEEKELMKSYSKAFYVTEPPTGNPRNIAEWEPMESVLIAYDYGFGIPYSLIAEMSEDCYVTTIVSSASEETSVRNLYSNNDVNLSNCSFVYQDPDSWWTRDYSPWYIAVDNSEVAIVNFPYNRPRPNDDDVPILLSSELGIDLYGMNIENAGGNYMCDGYGAAAATDLVWDENPGQTHSELNEKMLNYLGINNFHVTMDPMDDYIKHIDCWGKFLDVDKILITQVPETDYRYDDYEAIATYYATQNCSWGYPYEVVRVQANGNETNPYTNSLILNYKVFVPQTGSFLDDDAIATYEANMPGYEVIGVYSNGWENTDALHCRTHGVADREMLYIEHYPLHADVSFEENFMIEADVVSYGGSLLKTGFPKLFYRVNAGVWNEVLMTFTSGITYSAIIPGLVGENDVEYYISAENNNSKAESQPRVGIFDPHSFSYIGERILNVTNSEICIGSVTGDIVLEGYTETITDWEKRLDEGSWQPIGHTSHILSETPAEKGTWEYRVILDGGAYFSTIATIIVNPVTVGGTTTGGSIICEGESTGILSLDSYTGDVIKWQKQLNAGTWSDIENFSATFSETPNEDGTWSYRAVVKSGMCYEEISGSTDVVVFPSANGGILAALPEEICTGSNTDLSLSEHVGSIKWQESANGTDWTDISGETETTYSTVTLTENNFYRVNLSYGSCPDAQSNEVQIIVHDDPISGFTIDGNINIVNFINTSVNATDYLWDFGDGSNSIDENPSHHYTIEGIYEIILTASNGACDDDVFSQEVEVYISDINEINSKIKIYPNPNNGKFILQTPFNNATIEIFSINGQQIYLSDLKKSLTLDIEKFGSGLYILKIDTEEGILYKKLIVK